MWRANFSQWRGAVSRSCLRTKRTFCSNAPSNDDADFSKAMDAFEERMVKTVEAMDQEKQRMVKMVEDMGQRLVERLDDLSQKLDIIIERNARKEASHMYAMKYMEQFSARSLQDEDAVQLLQDDLVYSTKKREGEKQLTMKKEGSSSKSN